MRKKRGTRVRRGHFLSILAVYGLLILALFGVGWLVGFSVFPARTPPPEIASAPAPVPARDIPASDPASESVPPPAAPPPPGAEPSDGMETRRAELRTALADLTVPSFGIEAGEAIRFHPLPEFDPANAPILMDETSLALVVGIGEDPETRPPEELGAEWDPFRFPALDRAGSLRRVLMAGEAPAAEVPTHTFRLRENGWPAVPVQIPELSGIPLRRWAAFLEADPPRRPFTVRLAAYRSEAASRRGMAMLSERADGLFRVGFDLGEDGSWWSVYAGHFGTAEAARAFAAGLRGAEPMVRRMPFAVLVGLPAAGENVEPFAARVAEAAGFSPYPVAEPDGTVRLLIGAYREAESARALAARLRENGIPAWGVER